MNWMNTVKSEAPAAPAGQAGIAGEIRLECSDENSLTAPTGARF